MQRKDVINSKCLPEIIHAICKGDPVIYETYSEFDEDIVDVSGKQALENYINKKVISGKGYVNLVLHYPDSNGLVLKKKIDLIPEKCNGATTRYCMEGWGLIQVEMQFNDDTIKCGFAVNSEKRAKAWQKTLDKLGPPEDWNWKSVEQNARRLIRILKKCA